jgi:serine/threonine protein kinase
MNTFEEFRKRYEYTPSQPIGKGGFGMVFKAFDRTRDRWVGIKICLVEPGKDAYRLKHEVELAQKIALHENVAFYEECYTYELPNGIHDVAVMQYYPDGNLDQLLKTNKLDDNQKGALVRGILEGIGHLHNQKIIHRDIKPSNILIAKRHDGTFVPKITDFGISKQIKDNADYGISQSFQGGTFHYASPEQLDGRGRIMKNADLWSFGVMTHLIFAGKVPFDSDANQNGGESGRVEMYRKISEAEMPDAFHKIPEPYKAMISACLTVDVNQRVQDAQACKNILNPIVTTSPARQDYGGDETIIVAKPTAPQAVKTTNKWLLPAIGGAIAIAALGYFLSRPKAPELPGSTAPIDSSTLVTTPAVNIPAAVPAVVPNVTDKASKTTTQSTATDANTVTKPVVQTPAKTPAQTPAKTTAQTPVTKPEPVPHTTRPAVPAAPADTDNDGIIDAEDRCPQSKGARPTSGCPDSDNDGIADLDDLCPKVKGSASAKGCADADGDGVSDDKDICPTKKGTVASKGCPVDDSFDKAKAKTAINAVINTIDADNVSQAKTKLDAVISMDNIPSTLASKLRAARVSLDKMETLRAKTTLRDALGTL